MKPISSSTSFLFTVAFVLLFGAASSSHAQSRINYNNQQLFLNGANLAWISFADDIGPGTRDYTTFGDIVVQIHNHGGNSVRWWLHTDGTATPAFNDTGLVIGPGTGTIASLKSALDVAWEREIGVKLCLWSFDMLRSTNTSAVLNRNMLMLSDTAYTRAYINNCLIPMVDSLKHHPAIIAWEIFNEPEGMSSEFGFYRADRHVPMTAIQRFVNLCAGAIHRTDPTALVTNGAWSFKALTDVPEGTLTKTGPSLSQMSVAEKQQLKTSFNQKYRLNLSAEEFAAYLQRIAALANYNYYSDSRLIAAGGDTKGVLDFYSVHYYTTMATTLSPFHHPSTAWGLDKPIVVGEFAMKDTYGVSKDALYETLFQAGYAGALPWSWTDVAFSTPEDMLAAMQFMWDNHKDAVDLHGIGSDWADVSISRPKPDSVFAIGADVTVDAVARVNDSGHIVMVEFFDGDVLKIGERAAPPYSITWASPPPGVHILTAVATGNLGHKSTSNRVRIQVSAAHTVRLEAETASRKGSGITVRSDNTASNGSYLDLATNDSTVSITWQLRNVPAAGTYQVAFGYKLFYSSPKSQFINVNGVRVDTLEFTASSQSTWYEKNMNVDLVQGDNSIQMQMFWGWMYLDYLAVPSSIVSSAHEPPAGLPIGFSLLQNYPNPFNPSTTIMFGLPTRSQITIGIFNILGQRVAEIVNGPIDAGYHAITWNATAPSGVYFCRMDAEPVAGAGQHFQQTIKIVLLK